MTEPEPITVLDGDAADLDAVMEVMEDSFDSCYGEAWTAPQCAGMLSMAGVWLLLARRGEETIGFALSRLIAGEAELLLLGVKSKDQGNGAGQMLLDRFMSNAEDHGAGRLHLEVRDGNHAVNLYKRAGFTVVGRRYNYYSGQDGQIYDALTLAKTVNS